MTETVEQWVVVAPFGVIVPGTNSDGHQGAINRAYMYLAVRARYPAAETWWTDKHREGYRCVRAKLVLEDGTTVAAHVRAGHEGGVGLKPSDDLTVFLCFQCHMEQESQPGAEWWFENIFKPWLKERYLRWANANG